MIKTKIKSKIKIIYDSKLKSNTTRRYIRRKTGSLTRSRAENNPINLQIQGFSFCNFENKFKCSRGGFFRFSPPIFNFKHSSDMEMSLEEVKIKWF